VGCLCPLLSTAQESSFWGGAVTVSPRSRCMWRRARQGVADREAEGTSVGCCDVLTWIQQFDVAWCIARPSRRSFHAACWGDQSFLLNAPPCRADERYWRLLLSDDMATKTRLFVSSVLMYFCFIFPGFSAQAC